MSDVDPEAAPGAEQDLRSDVATVAKGGAVQIFGQISQRGLSFLLNAIALRLLGKTPYGIYRVIVQILNIASQVGLAGFNYATMRFIARGRAQGDHGVVRGAARVGVVGAAIASAAVVAALVIFVRPVARLFADNPGQVDTISDLLLLGVAYVPLFAILQVLRYCTQGYKTMVPSVVAGNIIQPIVRFVVGLAALLVGFEVAGLVVTLNVSVAAAAVAAAWFFRRMLTEQERAARPRSPVRPMIRFALPQGGSSLLGVQTLGLGVLLVSAFSTNANAGLFSAALMLQGPGTVFLGGILNIWAPVVSDVHARGDIERLESLYQTITRWVATFSFPVWAALILEADVFVTLFGGSEAAGAAPIVAILAAGNFFYTGTGPTGYVLSMTGRPGVNFINSVVAVALYASLGALIVPRYGAVGMAAVDAGVTASINIARVVQAKMLVGVQPFGRSILKPIAATVVGAVVLLAWRLVPGDSIWIDAVGIGVAAIAYGVALKALGLDAEERYVWNRIRKRALRARKRSRMDH